MSQSTITGLEQLLALENIRNTKARYCRLIDTKQWDALGEVFAPDAVADFSTEGNPIPLLTGRETIVQVFKDLVDPAVTVHHVHGAEVEFISDTEAKVISPMEDLVTFPEGNENKSFHGYGHYHETYVNIDGQWVIKYTSLKRLRFDLVE
ncbi:MULTISPECIES: nuclear transport factor 2 family protein [Paenibacillus]|uniref:nuclear transport factor 2 family protein n=1 Tax=Paenibacillus TaxID=44249 RepID=UPI000FB6F9A0|nr:nuclear transport factor 2 family protein [Paenibacillus sp. JJ-223]CAH1220648.1 Bile acid 7-alpha dehydratase [Paenibacillus sp. JJ-223]